MNRRDRLPVLQDVLFTCAGECPPGRPRGGKSTLRAAHGNYRRNRARSRLQSRGWVKSSVASKAHADVRRHTRVSQSVLRHTAGRPGMSWERDGAAGSSAERRDGSEFCSAGSDEREAVGPAAETFSGGEQKRVIRELADRIIDLLLDERPIADTQPRWVIDRSAEGTRGGDRRHIQTSRCASVARACTPSRAGARQSTNSS